MTHISESMTPGCGCDVAGLVDIDTALARIAASTRACTGVDSVPLPEAPGRTLAGPVVVRSDMPRFDHAAMDGYALRSADLAGPGPWMLPVVARIAAGDPGIRPHASGTATRIFTGAPLPAGADCVVMQEMTRRKGNCILLTVRPGPGDNLRRAGEEHQAGDPVLTAGTRLTARAIAACAAAGHGAVDVVRKLRVTLLVSGAEVATPGGTALTGSQIWDVNGPMMQAALARSCVEPVHMAPIPDNRAKTRAALDAAARRSDLIITSGGLSVGEEDHVLAAVQDLKADIWFSGVAMKPGKPVSCGAIGQTNWLGLPGNPQAALVAWTLFGDPILSALCGQPKASTGHRQVALAHDLSKKPGRAELRAAELIAPDGWGRARVACARGGHSGQITGLVRADGLVILPATQTHLNTGTLVRFLPFGSH